MPNNHVLMHDSRIYGRVAYCSLLVLWLSTADVRRRQLNKICRFVQLLNASNFNKHSRGKTLCNVPVSTSRSIVLHKCNRNSTSKLLLSCRVSQWCLGKDESLCSEYDMTTVYTVERTRTLHSSNIGNAVMQWCSDGAQSFQLHASLERCRCY